MKDTQIKHTPGPWHADLREYYTLGGDMVEITLHDDDGMVIDQIASVCLETGEDSPEDQKIYREAEANARLIAAAPDLLEACKEAQEALNLWTLTYAPEFCDAEAVKAAHVRISERGGTIALIADVGEKLRAAITKAEGEQMVKARSA